MQDVPRVLAAAAEEEPPAGADPRVDAQAGMCPAGHGIMSRARIEGEKAFSLERCPTCFGVWFDRGEWQRVAHEHLANDLPHFWSREWQEQQRRTRGRAAQIASARADLGDEVFAKVTELAAMLRSHPRRSEALAFLAAESDPRHRE